MDDIRQAAILLMGMGEQQAAEILKGMSPKQVGKIAETMNSLKNVSEHDIVKTLNEFFKDSSIKTGIGEDAKPYIRNALKQAVGNEKADNIIRQQKLEEIPKGFSMLKWQAIEFIFELLESEHPQVIAIALSYCEAETVAKVLSLLESDKRKIIIKRITHLGPVSPTAIEQLAKTLETAINKKENYKSIPIGGVNKTADIINYLDSELENEILTSISEQDEELATKIQDLTFPFEKLAELDDRSLQTLLADAPKENLILALKGVDPDIQNIFFKNMSSRAADMLKDDLEAMGPTQLTKVLDAQKSIVTVARALGKEGKIVLSSGSDGDIVM